jgi:addiction module RelE/StbE family toxin
MDGFPQTPCGHISRNGIVARIEYSPKAQDDLEHIGDYIAETLKNPSAALNTVTKIQESVDKRAEFPLMGAPLSSIADVDSDYRFLVCGNYLAFYHAETDIARVDRILYGKRDYLSILFGDLTKNGKNVAKLDSTKQDKAAIV